MATVSYWLCLSYPISRISLHPRPHTPLGRSYSTVLRKGASSLALFKYPTILFRRLGHSIAPNLSDNDSADVEDLRLMSLLKFVYFLLSPRSPPLPMLVTDWRSPASPSSPSSHLSPIIPLLTLTLNPGQNSGPVASRTSHRSTRSRSRCACSHTVVSPPARPTSSRILPKIRVPITNSSVTFACSSVCTIDDLLP